MSTPIPPGTHVRVHTVTSPFHRDLQDKVGVVIEPSSWLLPLMADDTIVAFDNNSRRVLKQKNLEVLKETR